MQKIRYISLLTLLLLLLLTAPLRAQTPPIDQVRFSVQAALKSILGRDFTLIQYTFEGITWEDGSLGCPVEGQSYAADPVPGYRWTFLTDDGIRYAMHSDLSGTQAILCPATSEPVITYSTYTGELFSIQHPNTWSVGSSVQNQWDFAFRGRFDCNLPGMQLFLLPNYARATALRNEQIIEPYEALALDLYGMAGVEGTTTTFTLSCEGVSRIWRGTAIHASNGMGYALFQWAPQATFPIWDRVFREMLLSFAEIGVTAAQSPVPTQEPTLPAPPVAPNVDMTTVPLVHVFVGDIFVGRIDDLPGRTLTYDGRERRSSLRIAPNTRQLAYIQNDRRLYLIESLDDGAHTLVEENVAFLPPAWSPDGTQFAYAVPGEDEDTLTILRRLPDGTTDNLGTVSFDGTCDRENIYTVERLLWLETGLTFEWLPGGRFLYSTACDGSGLAIWNPAEDTVQELPAGIQGGAVSPDRTRLAAEVEDGLVIIDLSSLEETPIATTMVPYQVGWDVTSTLLFYSAIVGEDSLVWDDQNMKDTAEAWLDVFPFESRLNTLQIFQLDTRGGNDVFRWGGQGFAVGGFEPAPDGSGILFTLIPSDRALLTNVVNSAAPSVIMNSMPETELYWLPATGSDAELLAISAQPHFAP